MKKLFISFLGIAIIFSFSAVSYAKKHHHHHHHHDSDHKKQNNANEKHGNGGEQCTDGVHEMLSWTNDITGNAYQWAECARRKHYRVDHSPDNDCVIVYPPNYGNGVNPTYGHVAVLRKILGNNYYLIQESNSGNGDKSTRKSRLDLNRVQIIHPR